MKTISRPNIDRVILISDIHLGVRNASFEWIENMTEYFDHFFIPLLQKYKEAGDNIIVVIAGDYFDNRQHIDINVLNVGLDIMRKLTAEAEVILSVGNHDIYKKKDTNTTSLRVFESFKNLKLITELTTLTTSENKKFLIVPWVGDPKEETNILLKNKDSADFFVLHSDIAGFRYDNGRQIMNGVNIEAIEGKRIYSGHIHKRQALTNATYIGSPYQLRRSDIGNSKGIYSIKMGPDLLVEEFVENDYSPKFLKVPIEDILELFVDDVKKIVYNNYVDIIIKRKWLNDLNVAKLMEVMDYCKPRKIEIILDKLDTEIVDDDGIAASNDMTIEDVFKAKINNMGLTDETVKTLTTLNSTYLNLAAESIGNIEDK